MGKEVTPAAELTQEQLLEKLKTSEAYVQQLEGKNASLKGKVSSLESDIDILKKEKAAQDDYITELHGKLDVVEHALETGEVIVGFGETKYRVIGKELPTLSQASTIGKRTIPASELNQYPEVIAELVQMGSGFLEKMEG